MKTSKLKGTKFYENLRKLKTKGIIEVVSEAKNTTKEKVERVIFYKNNTKELPYIDFGKNPSVLTFTCSKKS